MAHGIFFDFNPNRLVFLKMFSKWGFFKFASFIISISYKECKSLKKRYLI